MCEEEGLSLSSDCEAGNKMALKSIITDRERGTLDLRYLFSCILDAVHVGKSLIAGFANWVLLFGCERSCLTMLHTLRETVGSLRRILTKDAVMNKKTEWMLTVYCI